MTKKFYAKLLHEPSVLLDAISRIDKDNIQWSEHFGFNATELDSSLINRDPALKAVHRLQPISRIGLLMIPPSTFYHWHKDAYRQSCLNMLINEEHHSHTLFGEPSHKQTMKVEELAYEPKRLYLFNNQAEHCVINLGGSRLLFSLYFQNETPYDIVLNKLATASLLAE